MVFFSAPINNPNLTKGGMPGRPCAVCAGPVDVVKVGEEWVLDENFDLCQVPPFTKALIAVGSVNEGPGGIAGRVETFSL